MKKVLLVGLAAVMVLLAVSCTTRLGDFTVISTRNVDWSRASEYKRGGERVEGADTVHIILFIPTKANVDLETAVDDALDQIPGAVALTDVVMSLRAWTVFVYGQTSYIVTGTALVDPAMAGLAQAEESSDKYFSLSYNDDGSVEKKAITEAEYNDYLASL